MNRSEYVDRMIKYLEDLEAVPVQFSEQSYNKSVRKTIQLSTLVIPEEK